MENDYHHILLAVDFSPETKGLMHKAIQFAQHHQAKISLVHAIEPDLAADHIYVDQNEYIESATSSAKKQLHENLDNGEIPEDHWVIRVGSAKTVLLEVAQELNVDLIIVGSHGRHGWQRLLGSTANTILHSASCDVLMIRYKPA